MTGKGQRKKFIDSDPFLSTKVSIHTTSGLKRESKRGIDPKHPDPKCCGWWDQTFSQQMLRPRERGDILRGGLGGGGGVL